MNEIEEERRPNHLARALKALWRFFLLLLTGILVGGAIYFSFVQFYLNVVQVSQDSAGRISAAATLSVQEQAQVSNRMDALSQRVAALEKQQGNQVELISGLEGKTSTLDQVVKDQSAALARVSVLETRIATLTADINANNSQDRKLADSLTASDAPFASMQREVQVLKAMELVSRARLNLMQNNAGLAQKDVERAYTLLVGMKDTTPTAQKPFVDLWLQRLNLVQGNLPGYPVMAADDLEIAWRLLADGFNPSDENLPPTPIPQTATAISIPTPTALQLTPTP
jgi:hypothetical protein